VATKCIVIFKGFNKGHNEAIVAES